MSNPLYPAIPAAPATPAYPPASPVSPAGFSSPDFSGPETPVRERKPVGARSPSPVVMKHSRPTHPKEEPPPTLRPLTLLIGALAILWFGSKLAAGVKDLFVMSIAPATTATTKPVPPPAAAVHSATNAKNAAAQKKAAAAAAAAAAAESKAKSAKEVKQEKEQQKLKEKEQQKLQEQQKKEQQMREKLAKEQEKKKGKQTKQTKQTKEQQQKEQQTKEQQKLAEQAQQAQQQAQKPLVPPADRFGKLKTKDIPKTPPSELHLNADVKKRDEIREAFEWSWKAYENCAMGWDELHPLSCSGTNLTAGDGIGYAIVDSLDSLLIMDLRTQYRHASKWCRDNLSFDRDGVFNTFETTIRVLGGLLSAHYLATISEYPSVLADAPFYLERATDLGDRLLGAFDSPTGIPYSGINLGSRKGVPDRDNNGLASLAEAATLQLEFKYLSHLTGDPKYWRKAEKVMEVIRNQVTEEGIAPIFINPANGAFVMSEIRLGSRGDSYYEYLLKQWLQTGRVETVYRDMYDQAMTGIKNNLISRTKKSGLIFTQELVPGRNPQTGQQSWQVVPKQDHLVCFLGGSFILGVTEGGNREIDWKNLTDRDREDFLVGRGLVETCVDTYNTKTGLGAEIVMFHHPDQDPSTKKDWYIKPGTGLIDARNILRPETVESLLLAYRSTGDQRYRDWGWKIFKAFQKHCRVAKGGYAIIKDVQIVPAEQEDRMETFWLSETLKYLYLLFDDSDHIPLNTHVFNTEAHILPVFEPAALTPFSTS